MQSTILQKNKHWRADFVTRQRLYAIIAALCGGTPRISLRFWLVKPSE